jgi:hypothetical protein
MEAGFCRLRRSTLYPTRGPSCPFVPVARRLNSPGLSTPCAHRGGSSPVIFRPCPGCENPLCPDSPPKESRSSRVIFGRQPAHVASVRGTPAAAWLDIALERLRWP